ncbi:MAG: DPP IV N-terminal domain-containing protein [Bacteroidales bacterium]|nr:DPP IV N-terminal domain-containing protein [Bacteroidales bacterium]
MKRAFFFMAAIFLGIATFAQEKVTKANYALAERFSAKRVNNMVFSTRVTPRWFKDGDRFWYEWQSPQGTNYYIVDPVKGTKTEVFDLERLAMDLTEIVKDPFEARHIPITGLKLKDDKVFTFDIRSTQDKVEKPDTTKAGKGGNARRAGGQGRPGAAPGRPQKKVFHFEYDFASKTLKDVTDEKEKEEQKYPMWASVSPDGTMGVYAKNSNLWIMDSTNLRKAAKDPKDSTIVEFQLTKDGIRQFGFGYGNYSGDTQTDTTRRSNPGELVWSPDSKHFAASKWDTRKLEDLWVINSVSGKRPKLETYKYQMPGEPGPKGYLYLFSIDRPFGSAQGPDKDAQGPEVNCKRINVDAFKDQDFSLQRGRRLAKDSYEDYYSSKWLGDETGFYLIRQSRDIKRIDLCWVGVGADSAKVIIPERSNTYIETRTPYLIKDGKQIIWWSERNGWANLYLYNNDGTLARKITDGAFHVENVLGVNEKEGYVLLSACGVQKDENPYQMHTYRVPLAGGALQKLDMDDMDVLSTASDDAKFFVANYSRVDYAPAVALYGAAGKKILDLEAADLSLLFDAGYKFPERFKVKAADGVTDLYGAMYKPYDFDSTKVYPICDYVYPGPQVEANNISWSKGFTRTDRLAQLGIIVITVGNRGGHPNRSKWYHNYGYGNLRDYGLEDQKYAIQQIGARCPFVDLERVGIHGHSGGGFMSTAAILKYPDFFKAAVSCAGNHDNSIYNRWWSEQHHGILEKVDKGDTTFVYHIDTNQELAKNLKGHLMLVHGDVDNNVHPANTIRVVNALIKANKRFDMLLLPGQRHGFGDMNEYFFWRMADYYSEWLIGDSERARVDIVQLNND